MIHEGYNQYYGSAFKVSTISKWLVIVSGPQMIDDIRRASDEYLSFEEAVSQTIQTDYTLGRELRLDTYHIPIVRTPLTRSLAVRFADIKDEITAAFGDIIPLNDNEWTTVPALRTMMKIVCRTSNRLFVGLPLCRDPDYRELNEQFTIDVILGAQLINMFPRVLKPIVGRLLTKVPGNIKRAVFHVGPLIKAQIEQERQFGKDWPDKPNNLISWLLDEAQGSQRNIDQLAVRILAINFAAIHTTSHAFTNALYNLAAHPEYVAPMREEVEAVIEADGWTKVSMGKMRKVDSFIKESQRLAQGEVSMNRKVMKDFTFSNGITLPAGTAIAVAGYSTHMDEQNYDDSSKFQGFRFAEVRDQEGEGIKHQIVSLTPESLTFGVGRHACPGRFFAANELKAMLAHTVLHYDVKFPNDGPRPQASWFQGNSSPNRTAEVMFRKRA
jgi:cytochrome P450